MKPTECPQPANLFRNLNSLRLSGKMMQIISQNTTLTIDQEWGYYESFDSKLDSGDREDQNSGAYIFRPRTPAQQLSLLRPVSSEFSTSSVGTEVHVKYDVSWVRTTTRIFSGLPYVEVEYTVGPIPISDGRGKEIVTRLSTPLRTADTFYTDSNGREFIKRIRNHRPTWDLNVFEPVAGNYYPVNAAIYTEDVDSKAALAVVTDRSQGGASLTDGSLELMVHRRILADDARGVGEALNETCQGIEPEPPYGNSARLGDGIVIKGIHRILIGSSGGARLARSVMDDAFVDPLVFVGTAPAGQPIPFQVGNVSAFQTALPANIMLVTFTRLVPDGGEEDDDHDPNLSAYLIRLGHQYGIGEDENMSVPVKVDLSTTIFYKHKIVSITEKTLSGNQDYSSWVERRFDWNHHSSSKTNSSSSPQSSLDGTVVTLKPMDILTFEVSVEKQDRELS